MSHGPWALRGGWGVKLEGSVAALPQYTMAAPTLAGADHESTSSTLG